MSLFDQQPIAGPQFSESEARALVRQRYDLHVAAIVSLGSFQDQNFRITAADGRRFVLKVANAATDVLSLDLENQALMHLAAKDPAFPAPRVVPARDGSSMLAVEREGVSYLIRLLTYVPGRMLAHASRAPSAALLAEVGRLAGTLVDRLADFSHPGGDQASQWDLQYAPEVIRALLGYMADAEGRALIESLLARYEAVAAPFLPRLRKSMIHGDITSYNTLVERRAPGQWAVSGLVDFGDMARSYMVGELAVAVSEMAFDGAREGFAGAAAMVGAFHRVVPLTDDELAVLFDMVCLRRCVVIVSIAQQLALDPRNQYVRELSLLDWPALRRLASIDPMFARAVFRDACGLPQDQAAAGLRQGECRFLCRDAG